MRRRRRLITSVRVSFRMVISIFRFESNPMAQCFQISILESVLLVLSQDAFRDSILQRGPIESFALKTVQDFIQPQVCSLFCNLYVSLTLVSHCFVSLLLHRDKQSWLKMRTRCLRTCSGHCFNSLWSVFYMFCPKSHAC